MGNTTGKEWAKSLLHTLSGETKDLAEQIRKRPSLTGYFLLKTLICAFLEAVNAVPGMDDIHTTLITLRSTRIPENFEGLRILFFSDLHSHHFGAHQHRLVEAARALQPDLILVGGDWVKNAYEDRERTVIREAVQGLTQVAPLITNFGNHESDTDRHNMTEEFRELGAVALDDETVDLVLNRNGREEHIKLTGLTTRNDYYLAQQSEERRRALRKMMGEFFRGCRRETGRLVLQEDGRFVREENAKSTGLRSADEASFSGDFRIVLAHRPNLLKMYARLPADLVLCGHAHGGLMRLGRHRLLAPDQGLFPRYTHGFHRQGRTGMYISEGMGGPRFFIKPELTLFTLTRDKK